MAYAAGPIPTPKPPEDKSYTSQLSGGQIYYETPTTSPVNITGGYALPGGAPEPTYTSSNTYVPSVKSTPTQTPTQTPTNTSTPSGSGDSNNGYNINDIVNAMMSKGYSDRNTAYAVASADPARFASEYLGTGSQGSNAYSDFLSKNPYSDITPGWNPADFEAQLNEIYNNAMAQADKQAQALSQQKSTNIEDIEKAYGTSKSTLDTSKQQSLGTLGEGEISAKQQQEQALNAARDLYNQLTTGYSQRYGGATGAGEYARAIANSQAQKTMGQTRQATQDTLRQLATEKVNVEQNYQNSLLQLDTQKQSAISEANNTYTNGILQIEADKGRAANEKALAKMNLLKEYKTQLFNIQSQAAAYQANIQAMREQANIELESYAKQLSMSGSNASGALSSLYNNTTLNPTSDLQVTNSYNPTTGQLYTGRVSRDDLENNFLQGAQSISPSALQ